MSKLQKLKRQVSCCFNIDILGDKVNDYEIVDRDRDPNIWHYPIGKHFAGDFSMAVVSANCPIEDRSQVEVGRFMTFVGLYDGHGGMEVSEFVSNNLLDNILASAYKIPGSLSPEVFLESFAKIDRDVMDLVRREMLEDPTMIRMGSCCIVGIIWRKTLHIANLGDSRAVLGYTNEANGIAAEQLTRDHNTGRLEVRQELRSKYPDDSGIVSYERESWRVRGFVQPSRAFGNFRLKYEHPYVYTPLVSPEPSVYTREIDRRDKFVIFASDGLWEILSNQEVVAIVNSNPKQGIARRLISEALNLSFHDESTRNYIILPSIGPEMRRAFHDDISVVVIFLDSNKIFSDASSSSMREISVRGLAVHTPNSKLKGLTLDP